jgi:hypothetical protein
MIYTEKTGEDGKDMIENALAGEGLIWRSNYTLDEISKTLSPYKFEGGCFLYNGTSINKELVRELFSCSKQGFKGFLVLDF